MISVIRKSAIFSGEQIGRFLAHVAIREAHPQELDNIIRQVLPYIETGMYRGYTEMLLFGG